MARRIVKFAVTLFAVMMVTPLIMFIGYDVLEFQSRRSEISTIVAKATPDEQALSSQIGKLMRASLNNRTAAFAGRVLIDELRVPWRSNGMLGWHATNTLWWACVAIHLSEQEQLALIASRSYMGDGRYGYSSEALARFKRPLSDLSLTEAATLVALAHAPSAYASSPERLALRRDWLLRQVKNGS